MVPKQDERDEEGCADSPELWWLAEAFKGDYWICLYSFTSKYLDVSKQEETLCYIMEISTDWQSKATLSHWVLHHMRHSSDFLRKSDYDDVLQKGTQSGSIMLMIFFKDVSSRWRILLVLWRLLLKTKTLSPFTICDLFPDAGSHLKAWLASRCWLLPCLFTSESCSSLCGTIYSHSSSPWYKSFVSPR